FGKILNCADRCPSGRWIAGFWSARSWTQGGGHLDRVGANAPVLVRIARSFGIVTIVTPPSDSSDRYTLAKTDSDERIGVRFREVRDPTVRVAIESVDNVVNEMDAMAEFTAARSGGAIARQCNV